MDDLKALLAETSALDQILALLDWDQQTQMPSGGAASRADQVATLAGIAHEKHSSKKLGQVLAKHEATRQKDPLDAALLRVARKDYDQHTKLPASFVAEFSRATSLGQQVWQEAKKTSDFKLFEPHLSKIVDLVRKQADLLGYEDHPYDALLDLYEPGMKARDVKKLFKRLRDETVPMVKKIAKRGDITDYSVLARDYDEGKQEGFGVAVIEAFGYDLSRGRQDRAVHPFCTNFGRDDVRITTRFDRKYLPMALFGTLHETGHALYEQGSGQNLEGSPLAGGVSLGVHESQSRLYENLVGRSRAFWVFWYPKLQKTFPKQLGDVPLESFYKAINRVRPSLIRVEADELTYNLHIMLRFELELALLEGKLKTKDLPEAWNAKTEAYLGLTPPNDAQGVLQDVHWSTGGIGYFPTYTVGNVLSAQLLEAAKRDLGDLHAQWERGQYGPLRAWLGENIHRHGRVFKPQELVKKATGKALNADAYLAYLRTKFGEIYKLRFA